MAQVVAGFACSHVPFMVSPKNWERLGAEERSNLRTGFDRARQLLEAVPRSDSPPLGGSEGELEPCHGHDHFGSVCWRKSN